MRVAYVCADPGIPAFGTKGASVHVQEMLRAFLARGAEVTLVSPRLEGAPPADLHVVRRTCLPPLPKGDPDARARGALAANAAVEAQLGRLGPFDLIYERHALFAHGAMAFARRHGVPGVLEVNAPLLEEQATHRTLALPAEAESSARRALAAARVVTAVSPAVARYASHLGAVDPVVIPNAVNPARFPERPALDGPFTVGFLGTLRPWHDVATLVDAVALLRDGPVPDARLLIVGDGPERAALEARAAYRGIGGVTTFTGPLPPDAVPAALGRMHAAVAPYAADPPFYFSPLKLYEYMAAGLAVVASRVGHLPEVVADGQTGLLCPPGEALALAAALSRFADAPEFRAGLGRAARRHVLAHHTWERVADRVLACAGLAPRAAA